MAQDGNGIIGKHTPTITDAIANLTSVHKFADRLVEEEFISLELRSHILDSVVLTDHDRARRLVEAVRTQVNLNPSKFQRFIVILDEQPSLKSLSDRLKHEVCLQGSPRSLQSENSTPSQFSPSVLEHKWALLLSALVEILDCYEKALERMKTAVEQLVLSKPVGNSAAERKRVYTPVIASPEYKEAASVRELFRTLAPYWNWVECSLLQFVIEASRCKEAMNVLQEFLHFRRSAAPSITLQATSQSEAEVQPPRSDTAISSQPLPASTAPLTAKTTQGLEGAVVIKVDRETLSLKDYDETASRLSRALGVGRYILSFFCASTGCIAIHWRIPAHLLPYLVRVRVSNKSLRSLADQRVIQITIGHDFLLKLATIDYWERKQKAKHKVDIFKACAKGDLDDVLECLRLGVDVDVRGMDQWTPLMYACFQGHYAIVHLLLDKGANANALECEDWTPLHLASQNGHTEIIQALLDHGVAVDAYAKSGVTALFAAGVNGHTEVVRLLLEHGADPNVQQEDGTTALMFASKGGHTSTVQLLLSHHADVNQRNAAGWTALLLASKGGHIEIVLMLICESADINAQTKQGWSSLMFASAQGHIEVVRLLLDCQADVNAKREDGWTSLMKACQAGHIEVVQVLLNSDAEINCENILGATALDIASANEEPEIYQLLSLNGATHGTHVQPTQELPELPEVPQDQYFRQILRRLEGEGESGISDLLYRAPPLRDHSTDSDHGAYDPMAESNLRDQEQH